MSGAKDTAHPDNAMLVRNEVIFTKKSDIFKNIFCFRIKTR